MVNVLNPKKMVKVLKQWGKTHVSWVHTEGHMVYHGIYIYCNKHTDRVVTSNVNGF